MPTSSTALRVSFQARDERSDNGRARSSQARPPSRLLIIDDEPLLGRTLSLMFEGRHDVVVMQAGALAIERLSTDADFDLVLCDLDMPDVNGQRVYEWLRSERPALAERFVLMTGGAHSAWAEEFLLRYPGAQLEKPFSARDVEALLEPAPASG